jgi:iron complex outermembrane receptor protein
MKKIIFLLLLSLLCLATKAQNTLKGVVTDEQNKALQGATVYIPELQKGTTTNAAGEYTINHLPTSAFKVQYSYVGYTTWVENVVLKQQVTTVDIKMKTTVLLSQEVVVTGGYIGAQHDNVVKVDVLRQDDLERNASSNFVEQLTRMPGVDMIAMGQGIAKPVIRGLSCNNILVLNDGIRMENYQFSPNHPMGIDDTHLGHVEVIKGPASLLYGSDAIGGVLNLVAAPPAPMHTLRGSYTGRYFSNTSGYSNRLSVEGAAKHFFGGIDWKQNTHGDYASGQGEEVRNSRFKTYTLKANAGYTAAIGSFKLSYALHHQKLGMSHPKSRALVKEQGYTPNYWYQDLSHQVLRSKNRLYLGAVKWDIEVAYQKALRKLWTVGDVPFIEMNLNTWTYNSKWYLPVTQQSELLFAAQGMMQKHENRHHRASQFLPDANTDQHGLMLLYKINLKEQWRLQAGLRYDWMHLETKALGEPQSTTYVAPIERHFRNLTGSLGLNYTVIPRVNLRLNLAKSYRIPNLNELTSNGLHGQAMEYGNSNLKPQEAYEADLSLHYHAPFLSIDAACYYNQIKDYIYLAPQGTMTADEFHEYKYAQTDARIYGAELGVHMHPVNVPWLHLLGTYTKVMGKQKGGDDLPFIPADKIHGEVRFDLPLRGRLKKSAFFASLDGAFKQQHPGAHETKTPGYVLFNCGVNTHLRCLGTEMKWSLTARNVFDKLYVDHLSRLKPQGIYNQGRNVVLSCTIPFTLVHD